MDVGKLADMLRATIDPQQREEAETQLKQIEKIIGVAPALLQIVMSNGIDMPIRQAGAIYLKNMVSSSWAEPDDDEPQRFHIHEQDRSLIRDSLVDACVHAPPVIRAQLCVCIGYICRIDFPQKWPSLVDKICVYVQSPDPSGWPGAFAALLALVKVFEYKKGADRKPLDEAMNLLLPLITNITVNHLLNDMSPQSLVMQRYVLKIFYTLTQHHLPLTLLTKERFQHWMEIVRVVLDRSNPEFETMPADEDDKDELEQQEYWKTKKWAMRILYRIFERYGSPGSVTKDYTDFATWYMNTFSGGALQVVFKTLEAFRQQKFVAEKVLRDSLLYLKNAVSHSHAWKFMKPHANAVLSDIIYPLLCHSEADEKLWQDDPIEYVRSKYGDSVEDDSAVYCAEQLLNSMCKKRKGVLVRGLQLITEVLNSPTSSAQQKDGALHMVGAIADILLKKDQYKDQFENVLTQFVFPSFACPFHYLRARAAWLLSKLSTLKFTREDILQETLRVLVSAVLNKEEQLPVKVEAAFAVEMFIQNQHKTHEYIKPQVCALSVELLHILRATENDDLTNVLQRIVCAFVDDIAPIAQEICVHLANTFSQVMESTGDADGLGEKTIVAMGLLNTMETVLVVMEEQPDVCLKLEAVLLQVVTLILDKSIMEFYEEAFSLIASLTEKQISPAMWQVFEGLYRVVERDGVEYFVEMMPALHNYITVDTPAFLSDQNRVLALCAVIKKVLLDESDTVGEDAECHAAKLIEVLILQCRHQIQTVIPSLLQLVMERLSRPVKTSELRTMCLQVVVASFYHDLNLTTSVIASLDDFIKQWISDTDCFLGLHDRKICVLGLCALLQSPNRPQALQECSKEIIPSLILLFDGLKRAYASKALENAESDSEEEEDEDYSEIEEVLESDEDEIDDAGQDYLEALDRKIKSAKAPFEMRTEIIDEDDDDDDDDFSDGEETALECYATPLDDEDCTVDEYVIFKDVLLNLQGSDPGFYATLTNVLNEEQRKSVQEIFVLADQRKEAARCKEIEKRGGFEFRQQAVPSSFNFGSGIPPTFS